MIFTEFLYQIYLGILQTLSIDSIKSATNSIYEFHLHILSIDCTLIQDLLP